MNTAVGVLTEVLDRGSMAVTASAGEGSKARYPNRFRELERATRAPGEYIVIGMSARGARPGRSCARVKGGLESVKRRFDGRCRC